MAITPLDDVRPRRARHLIDPNAPRPVRDARAEQRSLTRVQQWVMSTLAVTTILHLSAGLILAAMFLPERRLDAEIGLNVIAGAFGVIAVVVALAVHGRRIVSPWLLLGPVPTIVGLWLTFSR
jgi:hypothetical protein